MDTILFHEEDISIKGIRNYLNAYLNCHSARTWQLIFPYFLKNFQPPLLKYKEKLLTFGDLYEIALLRKYENQKTAESEELIRPYTDWLKEAQRRKATKHLRAVFDLKNFVDNNFTREEIVGFYLFGSTAHFTYLKGASDLDTIVFVRKEVLKDINWLIDFRKRLMRSLTFNYLFNPLTLHGHWIVTEYDLGAYVENSPIIKLIKLYLNNSFELSSYSNKLKFKYLDSESENKRMLRNRPLDLCSALRKSVLKLEARKCFNAFELINVCCIVLSLLTKIYERETGLIGYFSTDFIYRHLGDILNILERSYAVSQKSKLLVKKAYEVRQQCLFNSIYPYNLRKWIGLSWDFRILRGLHRYLDRSTRSKILQIMGDTLQVDVLDFAGEIERAIKIADN